MSANKLFRSIFSRYPYDPAKDPSSADRWTVETPKEVWYMESSDHLRLGAWFFENNSDVYVIFHHGYHEDICAEGEMCRFLHDELGYNVLLISPRATGISEGDYITMGFLERYDLAGWAKELAKRKPESRIVLHGWSAGANCVMGALGEELPKNVICAVADCGFNRMDEQIRHTIRMKHRFLPFTDHLLENLDSYCRRECDFTIHYSADEGLELNHTPILFIHGVQDKVVPVQNSIDCHMANEGEKDLLLLQNTGHCESLRKNRDAYKRAFRKIVEKHI